MGLIKEPRDVEFYVIDKPWSEKDLKEFSELIKKRKQQLKKGESRKASGIKRRITERKKV